MRGNPYNKMAAAMLLTYTLGCGGTREPEQQAPIASMRFISSPAAGLVLEVSGYRAQPRDFNCADYGYDGKFDAVLFYDPRSPEKQVRITPASPAFRTLEARCQEMRETLRTPIERADP